MTSDPGGAGGAKAKGGGNPAATPVSGTMKKAASANAELSTPTRTLNDAPLHIPGAFDPAALLHTEPSSWQSVLESLSPALPVQMHIEPQKVDSGSGGPPIFHRTMDLVHSVSEVAPLFAGDNVQRARVKFRLSGRGKFIHRNRYSRRSVICADG